MKSKYTVMMLCLGLLSACHQMNSLTGKKVSCSDEETKKLVAQIVSEQVQKRATQQIKQMIEQDNISIDLGKLRAQLNQLVMSVTDIRTNNSDPNSAKEYCATEFIVKFPAQMIQDADAARELYEEQPVAQAATLADLSFEAGQLTQTLQYMVQPTDDGEKIYVEVENSAALAEFVSEVTLDALLKDVHLQNQQLQVAAQQQQAQIEAQQQAEYQQLLVDEAQRKLDLANDNINLVWNATTGDIRTILIDDQKLWLKKRELECKLESSEADFPEVYRLNCETEMTKARTHELKEEIYMLENDG